MILPSDTWINSHLVHGLLHGILNWTYWSTLSAGINIHLLLIRKEGAEKVKIPLLGKVLLLGNETNINFPFAQSDDHLNLTLLTIFLGKVS